MVEQNVASVFAQALFFTMLTLNASAQRETTDKMFTHRQTGDTGTQKAEGKRGGKKKKKEKTGHVYREGLK